MLDGAGPKPLQKPVLLRDLAKVVAVVAQLVERTVVIRVVAGSIPVDRPTFARLCWCAAMAKLVDAADLGSAG